MNRIKLLKTVKWSLVTCLFLSIIYFVWPLPFLGIINNAQTSTLFNHTIIDNQGPNDIWQKTVGDINGDGRIDLIAGGHADGGLVWYENPTWTKHTIASGGGFSTDAEVADVDKDGDNDVLSLTNSDISWYENPSWTVHPIESRVLHDLESADFDGDGDVDVVARDQGEFGHQGDELHFYRQNSPTSWTHRSVRIANGEGLKVADIDGDGDQDVVIGGSWFENTGNIINGTWTKYTYTASWTHPNAFVATGDVNGDGRLDFVLSPAELAGQTYRISWFEAPANPKSGNWTEHIVEDDVEAVHHFVGIADMDNDGDMDVASAEMHQGSNPDEVKVYFNDNGSGQSWTKQVIATTGSHSMRLLDVDNDTDIDLFGANWQGQQVELWVNQACSSSSLDNWERHVIDSAKPWQSVFITAADLDGDGQQDIITGGWWYKNPGSPGGNWTRNLIGSPLNNMAAVYDFDGDGKMDVLGTQGQGSASNSQFVWARNQGGGSFNIKSNIAAGDGDFLQGVAVGQFQTGRNVVMLSWHGAGNGIQRLTIPPDTLNSTWTRDQISSTSQDEALSKGDIDRDGDLDLLLGTIWLQNQGASWNTHTLHDTSGAPDGERDPDRNRLADINGDGRLDAVVGFEAINIPGKLAWYEQGPNATSPWSEHVIASVVGPMSLDVVDMDQDGDPDIIVGEHNLADPASAELSVFENVDGQGTQWTEYVVYTGDEHHDGAQVVDIDGDGNLDIISIGWGHDNVLLYENKAPQCSNNNISDSFLPIIIRQQR